MRAGRLAGTLTRRLGGTLARRLGGTLAGILAGGVLAAASVQAEDVTRTPLLGSDFPISAAVTVRGNLDTVYVSGALPPVINKDAPKGTVAAYGDMATQTIGALTSIKATLARLGLGMGDVVKMTVFMVADPSKDNKLDFEGLMKGYTQFFGTPDQPNKPARSAVQVAALVAPGALVEIEVIAAKPH
jgi:enamine deaminase RidA (YjgF/YER057c/UK114 family)